jgi:hypothetical protein
MTDDDARAYRDRARDRIGELSALAPAKRPSWAGIYGVEGPRSPQDPHRASLYRIAASGRVEEAEFLRLNRDLVFAPADQ